jgi:thioredoxin reductase (NADPH)
VVGGGNTAVEEALYLSNIASHVTLIHRRDKLRSEKILQDHLFERQRAGAVDILWNHTVDEVLGDDSGVTGVRVAATDGSGTKDIPVAGLFIAVGHIPNTQIFAGQLDMVGGYITCVGHRGRYATATSVPGVFAAGDVADHVYRQAVTSAGTRLHGRARRGQVPGRRGCRCRPLRRRRSARFRARSRWLG